VSSSALYACDPKAQLNMVLPAILDCLIDSKNGVQVLLEDDQEPEEESSRRSMSIHASVHPDNVVSDDDVTAAALQCLRALFKTPNGGNVRLLDPHLLTWTRTAAGGLPALVSASSRLF
jgi:hypothetical protein